MKHYQAARYKEKMKAYHAQRYQDNKERILQTNAAWRAANPEQVKRLSLAYAPKSVVRHKEWIAANPERRKEIANRWVRNNPAKANAQTARRRATKLDATPAWANKFFMEEAYRLAALRSKVTGIKWHVDHMVPLRHSKVCGLHVESNLQVIPALTNVKKGNRSWDHLPWSSFFNLR